MKKLICLIIIPVLLFACEISQEDKEKIIEKVEEVIEEIIEYEEPIVSGYTVLPIPEDADFYFFTDTGVIWKYNGQDSVTIKINAIIHYENRDDQPTQFGPHEFFTRDGYYYFSWMINDYYYDEDGELVQRTMKYYKQNNSIIEEIDKYEFSYVPKEYYGLYSSENFSLEIFDNVGLPYNALYNLNAGGSATFEKIYEVYENYKGIYFNVLVGGHPTLLEGLYWFPVDRKSKIRVKEKGRLWIK